MDEIAILAICYGYGSYLFDPALELFMFTLLKTFRSAVK